MNYMFSLFIYEISIIQLSLQALSYVYNFYYLQL